MTRTLLSLALLSAVVLTGLHGAATPDPIAATPPPAEPSELAIDKLMRRNLSADTIERLVNVERQKAGLSPLTTNEKLRTSACAKADDMIARNYWAHVAPDGAAPWYFFAKTGYDYAKAGENLAYGHPNETSLVNKWMSSPTHKENIVGQFSEQGICVRVGDYQGGNYNVIVNHFGLPLQAQ